MKYNHEYKYLNVKSKEILKFIEDVSKNETDVKNIIRNIFLWFDQNVEYTRLNSPYYPYQRSDIDTLKMRSGTCGDYSNLIVSVLLSLDIPAKYAFVNKDCYGDNQDHICAMAKIDNEWILIDATLPYRKWFGYNTPHHEFDVYTPEEFEKRFKKEEKYWSDKSLEWNNEKYGGLLYAPWIHEEIVFNDSDNLKSIFYLLIFDKPDNWNLYIYFLEYTKTKSIAQIVAIVNNDSIYYKFSKYEVESIWDEEQWSEKYLLENVPSQFENTNLKVLSNHLPEMLEKIKRIIP